MSGRNIAELRAALELTGWRLATTQRLAQVGDWTLDRDSGRMTWSRELFRMLERPQHLGEPDINEVLSYYTPSSLDRTRDLFWHAIDTGDRCSLEQEVLLPSGKQRHHFTVIEPHKDASGRVVRLYGTVQDITTRKRLEAERIRQLARVAELSRHMIEIEERDPAELLAFRGTRTVAEGVDAWNPVFDVTPHALIDAIVTERGVVERPDADRMRAVFGR